MTVPEDDKGLMTRSEMIARLVMAMGGRAAEELVFHEPTTGASSDIDQATKIARAMVTEYGMSARLGAVRYGQEQGDPFLGRSMGTASDYSHEVAREIDEEVRNLIEAAHTEAWAVLNDYRDELDALATALLERETLHRKDLEVVLATIEKRPRITAFNDFGGRTPSDRPPVKTPRELATERGEPWPEEPVRPIVPVGQPANGGGYPADPAYPGGQPQYGGYPAAPAPAGYPLPNTGSYPGTAVRTVRVRITALRRVGPRRAGRRRRTSSSRRSSSDRLTGAGRPRVASATSRVRASRDIRSRIIRLRSPRATSPPGMRTMTTMVGTDRTVVADRDPDTLMRFVVQLRRGRERAPL